MFNCLSPFSVIPFSEVSNLHVYINHSLYQQVTGHRIFSIKINYTLL